MPADRHDPGEAEALRHGLVVVWWLAMLLLPICREASAGVPSAPGLPLPLHAAFVLGSTTLLLLVRTRVGTATLPMATIAPLIIALGLGLELFATLLTLGLRTTCTAIAELPFYPAARLVVHADGLAYGIGALVLGLATRIGHSVWTAARADRASEAMLALLLAYAITRLLLGLALGLPTASVVAAWNVAAALPVGLGMARFALRRRPRLAHQPPVPPP